ncbi:hypothetical protein ACJMK2_016761 [Sinanodonta woodiana]|uniref:Lipoma HMGIC fusion partner-like 3 protein n=1 Tax=Sinanodonta woodiana TaxID=1069815 RepID=A0ABD3UWR9_SINWO
MTLEKYDKDTLFLYAFRFNKNHRALAVAWAVLSMVFTVLNVLTFSSPQWIGDRSGGKGYGYIGLYQVCIPDDGKSEGEYFCIGSFQQFQSILTDGFKASTVFCGLSALFMLIVVGALLLFFCFRKNRVFQLCGTLQTISAVFMFLACIIFPSGWNNAEVKKICGTGAGQYQIGECNVRWAYILAILGIFDAAILAILAFFLASKRAKIEMYSASGAVTKSELNGYNTETMSKKSIHMQPAVLTVPMVHGQGGDAYSEYSQVSKPRRNFQL